MENVEKKGPNLVVMTPEDLNNVIKQASGAGAKVALDKWDKLMEKTRAEMKDKRLRNTEQLLRNYHMFKLSAENSVYEASDIENEASANEMLYMMLNRDSVDVVVESIKKSVIKTVIILKHIDTMIELYEIYAERTNDEVQIRRYQVLYDRYIADPVLKVGEMADKYHVTKKQIYNDLNYAKEKVAALIFGIDSIEIAK